MFRAVVLAAGKSSRMGAANKLLLPLGRLTVIQHVLKEVSQVQGLEVVLVTSNREVAHLAQGLGVAHVFPKGEVCQSNSLKAGLAGMSQQDYKGVFFILGDQPFIRSALLLQMQAAFLYLHQVGSSRNIVVPYYGHQRGTPVLFSSAYLQDFARLTGDEGARSILQARRQQIFKVLVDDPQVFFDLDTPEDYGRALSLTGAGRKN